MQIDSIKKYFSLVKFSHTVFAMPFAVIGFFIAIRCEHYFFEWLLAVKVLLCMVFARNAAMGFNRFIDRHIDKKNPRTAQREIPAGIINEKNALIFVIINSILFIATTFFINSLVFVLSFIALSVILGYSYTKRFTALCHLVLGVGLSLAPIGAYLSVTGRFDILPLLFSFSVLFWVSGFDIIYALQDDSFDKANRLKSIPAVMGRRKALLLSSILHFASASFIVAAGVLMQSGIFYIVGAILYIALLVYQHLLVKPDNLSKVNMAFFTLNGIAGVVFAGFTIADFFVNN